MKHQMKPPRPIGAGAAVGLGYLVSNSQNNTAARRKPQGHANTFADWCRTDAPHQLSLDDELVAWLCRVMAAPEMCGITNLEELNKALRLRRTKLRFPNELAWHRLVLTAKTLWLAHGGKL